MHQLKSRFSFREIGHYVKAFDDDFKAWDIVLLQNLLENLDFTSICRLFLDIHNFPLIITKLSSRVLIESI